MTDPAPGGAGAASPEETEAQDQVSASPPGTSRTAEPAGQDRAPGAGDGPAQADGRGAVEPAADAAGQDGARGGAEEPQTSEIPAVDLPEDLRTARTPDTAPAEQPATGYDLPPSYPPARRPAPSRVSSRQAADAPGRRRSGRGFMLLVVVAVLVVIAVIKTFIVQTFTIPSGSMEDTLAVGDRVVVTVYDRHDLERGDVIVFRDPDHWLQVEDPTGLRGAVQDLLILLRQMPEDSGHILIKRVIGMPGDHIVADGKGNLTVNGVAVKEPYLKAGRSASEIDFDVTVPEGFLWVMGDNRSNSKDSRYHRDDAHGGFVPADDVLGVAHAVCWPVGNWSGLNDGSEAFANVPEPRSPAPAPSAPAQENGG